MTRDEIVTILNQAEEYKPVGEKILDVCESYKEQISDFVNMILYGIAQKNIDIFNYFIDNGFSREEALALTLQTTSILKQEHNNISRSR